MQRRREQAGLTLALLSRAAGVSRTALDRLERGGGDCSIRVAASIAEALHCDVHDLLGPADLPR